MKRVLRLRKHTRAKGQPSSAEAKALQDGTMPKQARVLVVGGGVAAAHAAQALCDRKEELPETDKPLCVILSAYPAGISPYDRSNFQGRAGLHPVRCDELPFLRTAGRRRVI